MQADAMGITPRSLVQCPEVPPLPPRVLDAPPERVGILHLVVVDTSEPHDRRELTDDDVVRRVTPRPGPNVEAREMTIDIDCAPS